MPMRFAIVFLITLSAAAAPGPKHGVAVINLSSATESANSVYFFDDHALALPPSKMTAEEAAKFLEPIERASPHSRDRFIATAGAKLTVIVVYDLAFGQPSIEILEKARETRLMKDLSTAVAIVTTRRDASTLHGAATKTYTLTRVRSTLTISAAQKAEDGTIAASATKTITTGPAEHLFLAADVPITKVKELTAPDDTGVIDVDEKPSSFYASLNYSLGDLFRQDAPWQGVTLKGFLSISGDPLGSYGVGIGYRSSNFRPLGVDLSAVSPFVGYFVTTTELTGENGTASEQTVENWRAGISFNLDRALAWVGGDDE